MTIRIVPVGDRLLVEIEDIADRKVGSIVIPDKAAERMRVAKVIAVGPGCNGDLKMGDRIVYDVMSGLNVHMPRFGIVDDNKFRFLFPSEVIAKVEEDGGDLGTS